LGVGALRTLAAIALKGPISQTDLVELRGSGVYQHVPELVAQGFVRKRRQAEGRSSLVQVTDKFYQHFEIDQLPQLRVKGTAPTQADDVALENEDEREPEVTEVESAS
ncbi:MAG: SMC-Scp complex subunit ScpB, partial [Nodosilinea sp.]